MLWNHVTSSSLMVGKVSQGDATQRIRDPTVPENDPRRSRRSPRSTSVTSSMIHRPLEAQVFASTESNDSKMVKECYKLQCTTAGSGETKALVFCRSDFVGTKHAQRLQKQAMADSHSNEFAMILIWASKCQGKSRSANDVKPSNYSKENQEFTCIPLPGTSSSGIEFTDKLQEATLRWVPHWTTGICVVPRKRDEGESRCSLIAQKMHRYFQGSKTFQRLGQKESLKNFGESLEHKILPHLPLRSSLSIEIRIILEHLYLYKL